MDQSSTMITTAAAAGAVYAYDRAHPEKVQERGVYWRGAAKGALSGIAIGIGVGLIAAVLLQFAVIPLIPTLAPVFGSFLTMPGMGGAFFPVPLLIFNTVLTMAGNAFAAGKVAVAQHKQEIEHRMNEVRIDHIEAREQALEQQVAPTKSRAVAQILARGAQGSHGQHQDARREMAAATPHQH